MPPLDDAPTNTDPRLLAFKGLKRTDPKAMNITCYAYAVADDATLAEFAARPASAPWRPPHIGEGAGLSIMFYHMAGFHMRDMILPLAIKDQLKPLRSRAVGMPLPKPSPGHRLVAIVTGHEDGEFQYHTMREHQGRWSSVYGRLALASELDNKKAVITDPRTAYFYADQSAPLLFEVPEQGVNLRLASATSTAFDRVMESMSALRQASNKRGEVQAKSALCSSFADLSRQMETRDPVLSERLQKISQSFRLTPRSV